MRYEACVRIGCTLRSCAKTRDVVVGHLLPLPLIRVLREERERRGVDRGRALEDGVQAALRGDVRADEIAGSVREGEAGHGGA